MRRVIRSVATKCNSNAAQSRRLGGVVMLPKNAAAPIISWRRVSWQDSATLSRPFWSAVASRKVEEDEEEPNRPQIRMPPRQSSFAKQRDCEDEISQLLNCPSEAVFDSAMWVRAEACILGALEEDDINLAFELLNRMARDPNARKEMSSECIYLVVQQWLSAYEKYQNSPRGELAQHVHSPVTIWRKVEGYLQDGIQMESRTIHRILEATAMFKGKKWNAPMLAESILEQMIKLSQSRNPDIRPSTYTFNAVIGAWEAAAGLSNARSQVTLVEAPERGLALLNRLKALHSAGWGEDLMPDRHTYRRVMNLFAHRGDGDQVESLLQELYELYHEHGHKSLMPNTPLFSLVLYAWSKSKDPGAAERAELILEKMLEMEKNNEFPGFKVTAFCFNVVMVCWSRQRKKNSAQRAQMLFDKMLELSAADPIKRPIPGSYAALIQTWHYLDAKKAEEAFWMWKREHNNGNCDMRMDSKLYSMLVAAWFHSQDPTSAERCDKLLQYALDGNLGPSWKPNSAVFNMTINAYCRKNNLQGFERAKEILSQMKKVAKESKSSSFLGPTASSYAPVIHSLTRMGIAEEADSLLREWLNIDETQRTIIDRKDISHSNSKKDLNTRTVNRVLKAWLTKASPSSSEAAERAEELLLEMERWGVKPNIRSFQRVLECRKKVGMVVGGPTSSESHASRILKFLEKEYESGTLNTDKSSYLTARKGWALLASGS